MLVLLYLLLQQWRRVEAFPRNLGPGRLRLLLEVFITVGFRGSGGVVHGVVDVLSIGSFYGANVRQSSMQSLK